MIFHFNFKNLRTLKNWIKLNLIILTLPPNAIKQKAVLSEKETATHSIFCLGKPMGREAWWARIHGVAKRVRYDLATEQQQMTVSLLTSLFKKIICNRLFFRAALDIQQNWAECIEFSVWIYPMSSQSLPLSTSCTRVGHLLQLVNPHWYAIITQCPSVLA